MIASARLSFSLGLQPGALAHRALGLAQEAPGAVVEHDDELLGRGRQDAGLAVGVGTSVGVHRSSGRGRRITARLIARARPSLRTYGQPLSWASELARLDDCDCDAARADSIAVNCLRRQVLLARKAKVDRGEAVLEVGQLAVGVADALVHQAVAGARDRLQQGLEALPEARGRRDEPSLA